MEHAHPREFAICGVEGAEMRFSVSPSRRHSCSGAACATRPVWNVFETNGWLADFPENDRFRSFSTRQHMNGASAFNKAADHSD